MPNIIYLLLPLIFYPLSWVLLAKYARNVWAKKVAFYRQLTMFFCGIPFLPFIISYKDVFLLEWKNIFLASLFWGIYVILNFVSTNLLPFMVSKIFFDPSRTIIAFLIAYFFFAESFNFFDIIGIIFLFVGFFIFSFSKIDIRHLKLQNIPFGISVSIFNGLLFTLSIFYFRLYGEHLPSILASYVLEVSNGIVIFFFLLLFSVFEKENNFYIEKKSFWIIFLLAPLTLLATYWVAKANQVFPFYIVNVNFIGIFVISAIFSYFLLKEKMDKKQILASFIIFSSLACIVLF